MDTNASIASNVEDISLTSEVSADFCKVWPDVEAGLNILSDLIKNPIVKATISTVIAAGDAISGKICPVAPAQGSAQ